MISFTQILFAILIIILIFGDTKKIVNHIKKYINKKK